MTVTLTYLDGTQLTIRYVESIRLDGLHRVITNTFGNHEVVQVNVRSFEVSFSFSEKD